MTQSMPSISVGISQNWSSLKSNELGMRAVQERAYECRGKQSLLTNSTTQARP